MATIVENITTIKNSINRMKEALNLPSNTSLEDLTLAVEDGGNSTEKSNIYKVKTIAERDTITDMVEGDMCVVQESTIANITATTEFQTATCPATVVLPTALNDYVDVRFNAVDQTKMFECWGNLDSNYFMMDCYTETGSIRIEYTSEDGITYTRNNPTEDTVDFGTPIVYSYPEMWNDVIGYFLQTGTSNFDGIFVYKDGAWEYAEIGIAIENYDLYSGKKAYSSNGIITGTFTEEASVTTMQRINDFLIKVPEIPVVGNGRSMFERLGTTTIPIIKYMNTSQMTNMSAMFFDDSALTELDLSSFDTSNVTDMSSMFFGLENLTKLDVSNFDTSNVTKMYNMFYGCTSLTELDLSNFNTEKVEDMSNLCANCNALESIDVSSFNTANATHLGYLFYYCTALKEIDVSNFNTEKATSISSMFMKCEQLTELDLSNFKTPNVKDVSQMFYGCSRLAKLDIRNFDFTNVTNSGAMFTNVPTNCLIIVKDTTAKSWITNKFTTLTNVKTVAEYEG